MPETGAITSIVMKIASRCNLSCSYCYEYNAGDESWKQQPHFMSETVLRQAAAQLRRHAETHSISRFSVSFHGGEPLLAGPAYVVQAADILRSTLGSGVRVDLGIQTNGTLLTDEFVAVLDRNRVSVAVSLDGPAPDNNRWRIYADGRGSYADVAGGLRHLASPAGRRVFAGILAVIDLASDPIAVFDALASWSPRGIDFLLPHGHWSRRPPGKAEASATPYADYLITIFDAWWEGRHAEIAIRTFEELIEHRLGGPGTLEVLGLAPVRLIVIACNGDYEAVDTMKSVEPGAHVLGLNVSTHSLDEVARHPHVVSRLNRTHGLSPTCQSCQLRQSCGGGYFPHRFQQETGFQNPSVYCADYMKLIPHVRNAVEAQAARHSVAPL